MCIEKTSKLIHLPLMQMIAVALLSTILIACKPMTLPTIGRTHGDMPMTMLIKEESAECFRVLKHLYFEAPFATGMSFRANECLQAETKVGQKSVRELVSMHVTVTFDGEFYIIKHGY